MDATSLPGTFSSVTESVATGINSNLILYPISEERNNGNGVKWIGLHPLDMIERVLLMTKQSTLSSVNAKMAVKRKHWLQNDIVVCDSLASFVLHERSSGAPQQCGEGKQSFLSLISTIPNCERLLCVVKEFETMPMSTVVNSYNRVKETFLAKIFAARVHGMSVDFVINETIDQVNAMMEMIRANTLAQHGSGRADMQRPTISISAAVKRSIVLDGYDTASTVNNRDKNAFFQASLVDWLIRHWANPFPDTAELNTLAIHLIQFDCISMNAKDAQSLACKSFEERRRCMMEIVIKKIETFLVNIRLRKWRKSIEDAFDMVSLVWRNMKLLVCFSSNIDLVYLQQRPATLLLEDSLRLFQRKALRSIEGWNSEELFASHPRYSQPLKAWKRREKVSKVKTRSASVPSSSAPRSWQDITPKRRRAASPKEQLSAAGLIELAKGVSVMSARERTKASHSKVVVNADGGKGLSPIPINLSYGHELGVALWETTPTSNSST